MRIGSTEGAACTSVRVWDVWHLPPLRGILFGQEASKKQGKRQTR